MVIYVFGFMCGFIVSFSLMHHLYNEKLKDCNFDLNWERTEKELTLNKMLNMKKGSNANI